MDNALSTIKRRIHQAKGSGELEEGSKGGQLPSN